MSDSLSDIEDYFSGKFTATEKEAFENKCISDTIFAEEVAFYVSMRDSLKKELYEQKKQKFAELHTWLAQKKIPKKNIVVRMLPYAAVACLLLVLGWSFFFREPSSQKMANKYINDNLKTLSVTMSSSTDSLQMGVAAYNNKNYGEAERILQALADQHTANAEVIKSLGIVYLITNQYDKAIEQFDVLAQQIELYANPGLFYKALTLLKRSAGVDKEKAKTILEEVRRKNLPGRKEAEEWILKL